MGITDEINRANSAEISLEIALREEADARMEAILTLSDAHPRGWSDYDARWKQTPQKSNEEITLEILKGGLEDKFGIDFDTFMKTYNKLLDESPERLI